GARVRRLCETGAEALGGHHRAHRLAEAVGKSMRRAAFALTVLALLAPLGAAQGDGFAAFWKEFSVAAAKKDKDKIRALTQYPSKEIEEKNFDVIWKDMFPRAMLACLAKA